MTEEKEPLGYPRCSRVNNIQMEIRCECVDWIFCLRVGSSGGL